MGNEKYIRIKSFTKFRFFNDKNVRKTLFNYHSIQGVQGLQELNDNSFDEDISEANEVVIVETCDATLPEMLHLIIESPTMQSEGFRYFSLVVVDESRYEFSPDQGCLPGLVLFLDNQDNKVVVTALKTLLLLAQHTPNRKLMREEIGMIESLKAITSKSDGEIKKIAGEIQILLLGNRTTRSSNSDRTANYLGLGTSNGRAKVITLQIRGLHQATRKICEEQLLRVKGVISFTFNITKARCTVRVKTNVQAQKLCEAISETKIMSAQQIVKNESGEEVVLSLGKGPAVTAAKDEKKELPDYLPEDEENVAPSNMTVARTDTKTNANGGGWFSGVSSFISNTLYW
eukprot:Seg955.6 transcript_id=Seg955.6/GoldUCD/mRNA.D3Y31 product="Armadillo repeat-containing protein 1" protein_id=Seg955.6/GoldUCD/D3Y31